MKKKLIVAAVLLFVFAAGCSTGQTAAESEEVFRIGVLGIEDNLPFFVAEEEDAFTTAGLNVELVPFASARDRDIALEAGELDLAVGDIVSLGLFRKNGVPVKAAGTALGAEISQGRFVLLSSPGSGILSPGEIGDEPVAVSENTIIHYLAEKMPPAAGGEEVAVVPVPNIRVRLEALLEGSEIRLALLPDPLASLAESLGANVVIDDTCLEENLSQTVFLYREKEGTEEILRRVLEVFDEAVAEINENPEAYRDLLVESARVSESIRDGYPMPVFSEVTGVDQERISDVFGWMYGKGLLPEIYGWEEVVLR